MPECKVTEMFFDTEAGATNEIARQFERFSIRHGEAGFDTISRIERGHQRVTFMPHDKSECVVVFGPYEIADKLRRIATGE